MADKNESKTRGPSIKLNTGAQMPALGLGTWKAAPKEVGNTVKLALESGYRHIDCAAVYDNEAEIGQSLKEVFSKGKIKREDVFITSKLWNTEHAKSKVRPALEKTLKDLQLSYLDLYLVHWPVAFVYKSDEEDDGIITFDKVPLQETWAAMEDLMKTGLVKAIGVSNYPLITLLDLLSYAKIVPAVNQVELSPYTIHESLFTKCQENGIQIVGYSPFGGDLVQKPKSGPLHNAVITELAKKYSKTPAQVILRWVVQRGFATIPKTVKSDRLAENLQAVGDEVFVLSPKDVEAINELNTGKSVVNIHQYWGIDIWQ